MGKHTTILECDAQAEQEGQAIQSAKIQRYLRPEGYIKKYRSREDRDRELAKRLKNGKQKCLWIKRRKNRTTITVEL